MLTTPVISLRQFIVVLSSFASPHWAGFFLPKIWYASRLREQFCKFAMLF